MEGIIFVVLIFLGISVYKNYKQKKTIAKINQESNQTAEHLEDTSITPEEVLPYKKKLLLSKNEWYFYKNLKPVADELGYSVLAKIKLADLVYVDVPDNKDYFKYFGKINQKHVDFALAKPDNLQIVLLIELDDNSHNQQQKERDDFVEKLYTTTGYKLLRVKGHMNIKEKILELITEETNEGLQTQ